MLKDMVVLVVWVLLYRWLIIVRYEGESVGVILVVCMMCILLSCFGWRKFGFMWEVVELWW